MKKVYVVNSKGDQEIFSFQKVYLSCKKAGAPDNLAKKIAEKIQQQIHHGIKTSEIYKLVQKLLKNSPISAIRFSLKEAMRKLGPSGFDFEKYIAEIFSKNGFSVKTNQFIAGKCISSYEIDFLAEKDKVFYVGECKYHTFAGARVDLKVVLYNYARFLDISKTRAVAKGGDEALASSTAQRDKSLFDLRLYAAEARKAIIVTNTKFTTEAIKYCKCVGVELLGWKYPKNQGLEYLIEKHKLYPVTILPSFKAHFKNIFAENKMMLALDILDVPLTQLVRKLKLSSKELKKLIEETKILLK